MDFGYDEKKIVLHDIKMFATPGQKIAFVGSTGAGKTTITNLINRFYDIQDGKIRYDGININKIKKADLRHSLGMVLQDTHLFTASVKDNIRYGKLMPDEEVIAAASLRMPIVLLKDFHRDMIRFLLEMVQLKPGSAPASFHRKSSHRRSSGINS